jgi:hypothetical protein
MTAVATTSPKKARKRPRHSPDVSRGQSFAAPDAVAEVGRKLGGADALRRAGALPRAKAAVARDVPLPAAVEAAAVTGKGVYAEAAQVASFNARAAAHMKPQRAGLNGRMNAPDFDVWLCEPGKRRVGHQLKTAGQSVIRKAVVSGNHDALVVPTEEIAASMPEAALYDVQLRDCVASETVSAEPVSSRAYEAETRDVLTRLLQGHDLVTEVERLGIAFKAGAQDALVATTISAALQVADALHQGRPLDLGSIARTAVISGAKSGARTLVQTHAMLGEFSMAAHASFRSRLVHRVAARTVVAGAVAEVVVETALDLAEWMNGEITRDELFRRFGITCFRAAGGAAGALAALFLARNMNPWVTFFACLGGGLAGAYLGEKFGEGAVDVFLPTDTSTLDDDERALVEMLM